MGRLIRGGVLWLGVQRPSFQLGGRAGAQLFALATDVRTREPVGCESTLEADDGWTNAKCWRVFVSTVPGVWAARHCHPLVCFWAVLHVCFVSWNFILHSWARNCYICWTHYHVHGTCSPKTLQGKWFCFLTASQAGQVQMGYVMCPKSDESVRKYFPKRLACVHSLCKVFFSHLSRLTLERLPPPR